MDNITTPPSSLSFTTRHMQGFTLIELLVSISIIGILSFIALPNMSSFLANMRVDNEISEMQRLILTARNMAMNTGKNTTICPLASGVCTSNWHNQISVFTNGDNTLATNNTFAAPDELVKVKEAIKTGDKLQYVPSSIIFTPAGRIITTAASFSYCPKGQPNSSRGIDISISGRSYTSSDTNNDGKDENRSGSEVSCTTE